MKKTLLYSFLIFFAAAGTAAAADEAPAVSMPKATVEIGEVVETNDVESRRYTGLVVSPSIVNIVPRVSGEIIEIGFKDGSFVKKGQMLYKLDPVQYEAAEKSAQAKVAERKASLTYSESSYKRNLSLFEKNAVSRDAMENSRSTMEANQASLLAAEAELITAKDNLKNTVITAPIDGIVGVTKYTQGNYLTPSSGDLITIIKVTPIRVRFSISTADFLSMFGDLENLKTNGSVKLKLSDGTSYNDSGAIEFINNEANSKTDAIQLFATFPNSDYRLIVGSTVSVTLAKKLGRKVAAIQPSAVMHDGGGSFVYTVDAGNKVEKRYISAGNSTGEYQFIESGLKPGEKVIVKGTHKTMPGGVVEPVNPEK